MTGWRAAARDSLLSTLIILAIIALDATTKQWARAALVEGVPIEYAPFFNLTLSYNRGVAFGLLSTTSAAVVAVVTGAITVLFAWWWWRERSAIARIGLGLIVGGAAANLTDRLARGAVTDFLDVHAAGLHWPTFNLADAALTIGVLLLLAAAGRRFATPG
jgi:signal peptidase II